MALREPPSRTTRIRTSGNDPRRLSEALPSPKARRTLAGRATFAPYSKHKKDPSAFGLRPYEGGHEDPSYCDAHAGFTPADVARAPGLLRRGLEAGLFGKVIKKGDPGLLWSVDDNGWIYEARVTNPGYAVYHAYPVLPNETIAGKVLMRYADYVIANPLLQLDASLEAARDRYQ